MRLVVAAILLANVVAAGAAEMPSESKQAIERYHHAKTFRARVTAIAAIERDGKLEVRLIEDVEIRFDRAKGIRATVDIRTPHGSVHQRAAWGPLGAIQSYREDRYGGFLSHLETRTPEQGGGDFSLLGGVEHSLPSALPLAELLIAGRFPDPERGRWKAQPTAAGVELTQRLENVPDEPNVTERHYRVARDGRLESAFVRMPTMNGVIHQVARFQDQVFNEPIERSDLAYAPPENAPAFDIRGPLDRAAKRERLRELAVAGNRDAKIRMTGVFSFDSTSKTPMVEQFRAVEARLIEAERFGFGMAYVWHAQMIVADNRDWMPPELARLSDGEIRAKQRALLFEGARACTGEAAFALTQITTPPVTSAERERLKTYAAECATKRIPPRIAELQKRLDAGATLEDAIQ